MRHHLGYVINSGSYGGVDAMAGDNNRAKSPVHQWSKMLLEILEPADRAVFWEEYSSVVSARKPLGGKLNGPDELVRGHPINKLIDDVGPVVAPRGP